MAQSSTFKFFNSEKDVIIALYKSPEALLIYKDLPRNVKQDFLDVCMGKRGIPLHYDVFFKALLSPDKHPKRLGRLLSQILGQPVEVVSSISNEGTKICDKGSFVLMDIVVRLLNGEIVNLEIQKVGYLFPVKRFDCYCADLTMREYSRLREAHGKDFTYDMLPKIISIALFETTPSELSVDSSTYIQHSQMRTEYGRALNSVHEHYYVSLDNFAHSMHNKPIKTELEAWLMLLNSVNIERINEIIEFDSKFADIYKEMFEMTVKPEELIHMYGNIFLETDKYEEQHMLDMMKKEIEDKKEKIQAMDNELQAKDNELLAKNSELQAKDSELQAKDNEIARLKKLLESNQQ